MAAPGRAFRGHGAAGGGRALLWLLLAAWGSASGQEPDVPLIEHQPLRCAVRERFVLVDAYVRPAGAVTRARVYFAAGTGGDYYAVEMQALPEERFQGRLPKPKQKDGRLTYFIEVVSQGDALQRTPEFQLELVKDAQGCPEPQRVAAVGGGSDVEVLATLPGQRAKPKSFGGVARLQVLREAVSAPEGAVSAPAERPAEEGEASAQTPPAPGAATASEVPGHLPAASLTPSDVARLTPATPVPDFAIGPEDSVKIVVVGHDDLSQTVLVQSDGTIIFPLLGRVQAAELVPRELEKKLTAALAQGLIRNPQVSVTVSEYRSKTVMVMGEVARPGPYPLSGTRRIVEVLAKAGMTAAAGSDVQVVRPLGPTDRPLLPSEVAAAPAGAGQAEILKVDLRAIQAGDLEKNIPLRPNDTVYVPSAAKFYVTGEARTPGAYTLTPGLTVREAVIVAGGFGDNASAGRTRVIRAVDGRKREIKVKLDDPVQAGDIIVVKGKLF